VARPGSEWGEVRTCCRQSTWRARRQTDRPSVRLSVVCCRRSIQTDRRRNKTAWLNQLTLVLRMTSSRCELCCTLSIVQHDASADGIWTTDGFNLAQKNAWAVAAIVVQLLSSSFCCILASSYLRRRRKLCFRVCLSVCLSAFEKHKPVGDVARDAASFAAFSSNGVCWLKPCCAQTQTQTRCLTVSVAYRLQRRHAANNLIVASSPLR